MSFRISLQFLPSTGLSILTLYPCQFIAEDAYWSPNLDKTGIFQIPKCIWANRREKNHPSLRNLIWGDGSITWAKRRSEMTLLRYGAV